MEMEDGSLIVSVLVVLFCVAEMNIWFAAIRTKSLAE